MLLSKPFHAALEGGHPREGLARILYPENRLACSIRQGLRSLRSAASLGYFSGRHPLPQPSGRGTLPRGSSSGTRDHLRLGEVAAGPLLSRQERFERALIRRHPAD